MGRNFLIGPASAEWTQSHLPILAQSNTCKSFDWQGSGRASIDRLQSWQDFQASWDAGWSPDYCVIILPYTPIPKWMWRAPIPIVGLAKDWSLHWSCYRHMLDLCDIAFTDTEGCRRFASEGLSHVRHGILYGGPADASEPDFTNRDIDIGFAGNLNRVIQEERAAWLMRLAQLGERWNVAIRTRIFAEDYHSFLRRCKIVFNRSLRGEWNMRVGETLQAGAVLFQEERNAEVRQLLIDRVDCVFYNDRNLEELLDHYLRNDEDRIAIARAGHRRLSEYRFEQFWLDMQTTIDSEWQMIKRRRDRRRERCDDLHLATRVWQSLSTDAPRDKDLAPDLAWRIAEHREDAQAHFLQGVQFYSQDQRAASMAAFEKSTLLDPGLILGDLNRIELLAETDSTNIDAELSQFIEHLMSGVDGIDRCRDLPHLPPKFDEFRVQWEKAAWSNCDDPAAELRRKTELLLWRAYTIRGIHRGRVEDFQAAVARCPEIVVTQLLLGQGLLATGHAAESIIPLRAAWSKQPFLIQAARMLYDALLAVRDLRGARAVAKETRLLAKSCPTVERDSWFEDSALVGNELASIVLICLEPVELAKHTLAGVLRTTDTPFELFIVARGSTALIAELRTIMQNPRINSNLRHWEIVVPDATTPLASVLDETSRIARGTYLAFVHGNVHTTQGWLSRLVDWSLVRYPKIGLVGPDSNRSSPLDDACPDTVGIEEIEQRSRNRRRRFADKAQLVSELEASFLLIRRDVVETLFTNDGFRFGDLLADPRRRIDLASSGFEHILARDVYVHFIDPTRERALEAALALGDSREAEPLRPPWEVEVSRLPPKSTSVASPTDGISLCMIVKNEEANLGACLHSVADLVDEVIIVDTGSTDATKTIAYSFGAKVFDFPWVDDFAAARNESLRHATRRWIFWMDADDRLDAASREMFRSLRPQLDSRIRGYVMKCLCLPDESGVATLVDHVRLFPNRPNIRWRYRVHEQILGSIRDLGGDVTWTKVVIHHVGYQDPQLRARKRARDMQILLRDNDERPDDPFTLFNIGQILHELGRIEEALAHLRRSLEVCPPNASIVRKLYSLIANIHRSRRHHDIARRMCEDGVKRFPDDPELMFQLALCCQDDGDVDSALTCYLKIVEMPEADFFASSDPSLKTHKAHHNIAVLYRDRKSENLAEEYWQKALSYSATFIPSLHGLADLYLAQHRWGELSDIVARLRAIPAATMAADILDARRVHALGDTRTACTQLELIHSRHPNAVTPLVHLGQMLFELEEWQDAEVTLRKALALNPDESEARRSLNALLQRRISLQGERPRISLCIIVRNEELRLGRCLRSIRGLVDETIVVDTGSTDRTLDVAREFGASVTEIHWPESFAQARNQSLAAARGEWIFYLDADEFLDEQNQLRFRTLTSNLSAGVAYFMKQVSPSTDTDNEIWTVDQVRLFPNLPDLRWSYRVHEQILPALRLRNCTTVATEIQISHDGFSDRASRDRKVRRNIELLVLDVRDYPNSGFVWFNLGSAYFDIGEDEKAIESLENAVRLCEGRAMFVPRAYKLQLASLRRLNRLDEALSYSEKFLQKFSNDQELLLEQGIILAAMGRNAEAGSRFTQVISSPGAGISLGRSRDALAASARCHLAELTKSKTQPRPTTLTP